MNLADLSDKFPRELKVSYMRLLSFGNKNSISGEISTAFCGDDNSIIKEALSEDGKNKILVIDANGVTHESIVGDEIASMAIENNWQGIVLNGFIRDADEINKLNIKILAKGEVLKKRKKNNIGRRDILISFGGLIFKPGYWLYADKITWGISRKKLEL